MVWAERDASAECIMFLKDKNASLAACGQMTPRSRATDPEYSHL